MKGSKLLSLFIGLCLLAGCGAGSNMIIAAKAGDIGKIKHLTSSGSDINEQDYMYRTPLITAIISGKKEKFRY